jgi:transcriptional regulator with XRE-family HTH domain
MLGHVSDIEVGAELRRRRNELGLTLRQVSDQTDLTSGFLSQVENDLVSPSLKSLGRIAEVLRIPLFQLLSTNGGDPVVRADQRQTVPFAKMGVDVELLTPFRDWQLLPFQRVFEPGEEFTAVRLEGAREEWILIQGGTLEVTLHPDEQYVLHEGDTIHFESSRLVGIKNTSSDSATYLCMMTPPAI